MIDAQAVLSIRRQCELLGLSRSGLYYEAVDASEEDLALMRRVDEIHLALPFYGSRKLTLALRAEGHGVNRKRVQRLMRLMGLESIAPKPKTNRPHPEHPVYPYLLRHLEICRPNQVWADITYIPMRTGFGYVVAIIDWYSRRVLSWRLSNTLDSSFCLDALDEALSNFSRPEIFNSDQGAQFTADVFTQRLSERGIAISMDGRGRCIPLKTHTSRASTAASETSASRRRTYARIVPKDRDTRPFPDPKDEYQRGIAIDGDPVAAAL